MHTVITWLALLLALACGLVAVLGEALWIRRIALAFIRDRHHTLRKRHVSIQAEIGMGSTMLSVFIPFLFSFALGAGGITAKSPISTLMVSLTGVLVILAVLLWLCT